MFLHWFEKYQLQAPQTLEYLLWSLRSPTQSSSGNNQSKNKYKYIHEVFQTFRKHDGGESLQAGCSSAQGQAVWRN